MCMVSLMNKTESEEKREEEQKTIEVWSWVLELKIGERIASILKLGSWTHHCRTSTIHLMGIHKH
jgi:hypothetical protein